MNRLAWLALAASFLLSTALCAYAWLHIQHPDRWVLLPAAIYAAGWAWLCWRRGR